MRIIKPLTFAANQIGLASSNIPENDYPAWVQGQSVTIGDRRIYEHRVWEALVTGSPQEIPGTALAVWLDDGPTNQWAMLDGDAATATTATGQIMVVLNVGAFDSVALLGLSGYSVTVTTGGSGGTVLQALIPAAVAPSLTSSLTLTGLDYAGGQVTISIDGPGSVSCSAVSVGTDTDLGQTLTGARIEIVDYSKKVTDAYGTIRVTKRGYSRRIVASVLVDYLDVDRVFHALAAVRQTPSLWTAIAGMRSGTVYGYYADWQLVIDGPTHSVYSITIESLALNNLQLLPGEPITPPPASAVERTEESGLFRYTEDGIIRTQEA